GEPREPEKLADLGLCVGSDVPFCLTGGTQWAEGVGERLTPLPALASCSIVIVRPAEGMRTPEAFARYDALTSPPTQPNSDALRQALKDGSLGAVAAHCGNALEASCPVAEVAVLKAALRAAGALGASMTGSGTAVFGLFSMEEEARAAASALAGSGRIILCTRPAKRGVVLQPLV
ncbi:MAG: 4-(cytidine 5'-diphospho)-2-C-methyl-D-erythritol kinase, partial [Ruthenibacterium sp.]